jgi:hypothetical protein
MASKHLGHLRRDAGAFQISNEQMPEAVEVGIKAGGAIKDSGLLAG